MIGGAISGYCATGSVGNATRPAIMIRIAITHATIGRRMKNRLNTRRSARAGAGAAGSSCSAGFTGSPAAPAATRSPQSVPHREALEYHSHRPIQRPDLHAPDLYHILLVHHIRKPPRLIRQQRDVGRQDSIRRLQVHRSRTNTPAAARVLVLKRHRTRIVPVRGSSAGST
jgi:hypothetical protein